MINDGEQQCIDYIAEEGEKGDLVNYRPVNLASLPGKTLEQILIETIKCNRCLPKVDFFDKVFQIMEIL